MSSPSRRLDRFGLAREPVRGLLALAGVLLLVTALQPWATGTTAAGRPLSVRPTEGMGEGVYLVFGGLLLLGLAATRLLLETTNRLLQLVPPVVAVITAVMWLNANRLSLNAIASWEIAGGAGAQTLAPFVALAGVGLVAGVAVLLEVRRPAEIRRETRSLGAELGINRRGLLGIAIAGLLGLAGGAVGLSLTVAAFGMRGVLPGILLGTFGFVVGLTLGGRLARRLNAPR